MNRKLDIEFPDFGITVTATMLDDSEPELCNLVWGKLPLESACVNTLSTGDFYISRVRPPHEAPKKVGTQDNPIGRKLTYLCDRKPGDIGFNGTDFFVNYGPNVTEPLPGHGSVFAKVNPEHIDAFYKAGKLVWNHEKVVHDVCRMIVKRKED